MNDLIIHPVIQGSDEWLELRRPYFTASEAVAMMGCSSHMSRGDLLKYKATGIGKEIDAFTQKLFNEGHAKEALARPLAEVRMNTDLYPVTATRGKYLASLDGLSDDDSEIWEHKLLNKNIILTIRYGELEPAQYWQLEHQLYVMDAERILFTCSDGTEENMYELWYSSDPARREELIHGWELFYKDLENYVHIPEEEAEIVATALPVLASLRGNIVGEVKDSNIAVYREQASLILAAINTKPVTDQEFADGEVMVKFLKSAKEQVVQAKANWLSQAADIDALMKGAEELEAMFDTARLALEKNITARKKQIKESLIMDANNEYQRHVSMLDRQLGFSTESPQIDFQACVKNKRTLKSMKDSLDEAVAAGIVATNIVADGLEKTARKFDAITANHQGLFSARDKATMIRKDPIDMMDMVEAKIAAHDLELKRHADAIADKAVEDERRRVAANEAAMIKAAREEAARIELLTEAQHEGILESAVMGDPVVSPHAVYSASVALNEYQKGFIAGLRKASRRQNGKEVIGDDMELATGIAQYIGSLQSKAAS